MRVDLDASVQRAVVDPRRNAVTHFVINTGGPLGRDVSAPAAEIERARPDGEAIRLVLSRDEVERLPAYVPADYVAPPADWTFPVAYAFGAYGGDRVATEPGRPTVGKEAVVFAQGGEDVGVVLPLGGVLRTLLGGGETVQVGGDAIARVEEGAVRLRLTEEEVERLAA